MPEFNETLANQLAGVPWSIKVMPHPKSDGQETCYFFKYFSDDSKNMCCFLITDTINVWVEVLDSKHTSHRARHAHSARSSAKPKRGFALPYHDADEEAEWRRAVVKSLGEVHSGVIDGIVDLEVRESEMSDLSVYISDPVKDFHWRWDVMSIRQMAGSILSKQLFMPLVTLATIMSSLEHSLDDASENTLRTIAERKASTAKAMPAHFLRGFFSRTPVRTLLNCIAQVDATQALTLATPRNPSMMSVDMTDATPENIHRESGLGAQPGVQSSSANDGQSKSDRLRSSRKRRDSSTEDEEGGWSVPRSSTRRLINGRLAQLGQLPIPIAKSPQIDPNSTATEAEVTRDRNNSSIKPSHNQTADRGSPPLSRSARPRIPSPTVTRSTPRAEKKQKSSSLSPVPQDASEVFGVTQTQASSDDSDRDAELERRIRAAGTVGSAAVRTPASGGLGSRMVRKKF